MYTQLMSLYIQFHAALLFYGNALTKLFVKYTNLCRMTCNLPIFNRKMKKFTNYLCAWWIILHELIPNQEKNKKLIKKNLRSIHLSV